MLSKIFTLWVVFILSINLSFADIVEFETNPRQPIKNETFELIVKVQAKGSDEPFISFDPGKFEVLGRRSGGYSSSTTIINGRISTKKEFTYIYELQIDKSGTQYLKNIKVEIDGKSHDYNRLKINVLAAAARPKDMILVAVPSKTKVYVGEGFDVNYYYYFNNHSQNIEIKSFPKLDKFLKRFRNPTNKIERVEYQGRVYKRQLQYSARLYAEKAGKAKIDPLAVRVDYVESGRGGYGGFGMAFGRRKSRSLRSKKVDIEVLPLPSENVPTDFTGLVGDHEFKLVINKNKFLVNEAIEAKLEVTGVGALEKYDAPKIYEHENLEEFDTKSELESMDVANTKKVFDYTYLARGPLDLAARDMSFSYFDPESGEYKTKQAQVSALLVSGKAISGSSNQATVVPNQSEPSPSEEVNETLNVVGPVFYKSFLDDVNNKFKYYNIALILFIFITLASIAKSKIRPKKVVKDSDFQSVLKKIKKSGATYSDLYQLLSKLDKNPEITINQKISKSNLSKGAKHYFDHAILATERAQFKDNSVAKIKFEAKHYKELSKHINEINN